VARLECSLQPGENGMRQEVDIRYVVTSLKGSAPRVVEVALVVAVIGGVERVEALDELERRLLEQRFQPIRRLGLVLDVALIGDAQPHRELPLSSDNSSFSRRASPRKRRSAVGTRSLAECH
jgi:hypothetical protein